MSAQEFIEAALGGAITTSVAAYERDIDHAVALERERCLAIIDEHLAKLDRANMHTEAFRLAIVREQIAGHMASTPPNAQERG